MDFKEQVRRDMEAISTEWLGSGHLNAGDVFVVGCSTSEVSGERIGTSGSEELAAILFEELSALQADTGIVIAFQCCEHLNRALVVEKETMQRHNLEEVTAIPVPRAGGSMASFAYKNMKNPVVVETIKANSGIDIGETMIGMHLKPIAVPLRFEQRSIGNARVTAARTRPKLIGGKRAVYDKETAEAITE
ncbi:TIGR01440 family protein [Lentibacillus sp. CBA3610]|uniref:TIGR01440 family protein n=1 Tax=Lentibacillus sp. CBA3610 TaxID=2518176 RepID=UPI0015955AD2|nr:TIGR01440 family protein [Lentibacillus sp. CBA3610]QKY71724.1 TIGR01440 family protein [Lentibacillus sp. CBA3610]